MAEPDWPGRLPNTGVQLDPFACYGRITSSGSGPMMFAKHLREPVMRGEITCSVRIWQSQRVKVGGRYRLGPGWINVTSVREIGFQGITPELARRSGFQGVIDLLKVAKHGAGETVYLVEFDYEE